MYEEITTIFVVGFPDDMRERDFINMFIFSTGFEAATLKIPPSDEYRKQIIGFAKFRTRQQALEARDVLSGRKVDGEKGCVLKAEMAKKNLHTKRRDTNDYYPNGQMPLQRYKSPSQSAYDAFHSVPSPPAQQRQRIVTGGLPTPVSLTMTPQDAFPEREEEDKFTYGGWSNAILTPSDTSPVSAFPFSGHHHSHTLPQVTNQALARSMTAPLSSLPDKDKLDEGFPSHLMAGVDWDEEQPLNFKIDHFRPLMQSNYKAKESEELKALRGSYRSALSF